MESSLGLQNFVWCIVLSFFLPLLCSVNSDHDNRFGLWHISFNNNNKKKFCDTATSRLKTIYKKSSGKGIHTYPLPNLGYYVLALNPSTVSAETASVVRPFQDNIFDVYCNCPWEKRALQTTTKLLSQGYQTNQTGSNT